MINCIAISILLLFTFKQVNSNIIEEEVSYSKHDCEPLLKNFSLAISNFTYCSVNHARPVSLCNKCVSDYILILRSYKNLTQTYVNGTACIDNFINLDRLEVVNSVYKNANELWSRARCDGDICTKFYLTEHSTFCFAECLSFTNGSLSPEPSKVKKDFDTLFETFIDCTNGTNGTTVCDKCMNDYIELNNFYFKIGDITHGINGLCMDIVDLMNQTQAKWSITCCKYRIKNETIYISTIVVMFALPVIFYILVKFLVDIKRPTLLLQNRFAESINTPSTSYRRESL